MLDPDPNLRISIQQAKTFFCDDSSHSRTKLVNSGTSELNAELRVHNLVEVPDIPYGPYARPDGTVHRPGYSTWHQCEPYQIFYSDLCHSSATTTLLHSAMLKYLSILEITKIEKIKLRKELSTKFL